MKKHGFALVNKQQLYLQFEQVSSDQIEIYGTRNESDAHLFDTIDEAREEANNIISKKGKFTYYIFDEDKPVSIAEITIVAHAEEAERLEI